MIMCLDVSDPRVLVTNFDIIPFALLWWLTFFVILYMGSAIIWYFSFQIEERQQCQHRQA